MNVKFRDVVGVRDISPNNSSEIGPKEPALTAFERAQALSVLALNSRQFSAIQDGLQKGDLSVLERPECRQDAEVRDAARQAVKTALTAGEQYHADRIISRFNLREEVRKSGEYDQAKLAQLLQLVGNRDQHSLFHAAEFVRGYGVGEIVTSNQAVVSAMRGQVLRGIESSGSLLDVRGIVSSQLLFADADFEKTVKDHAAAVLREQGWDRFAQFSIGLDTLEAWCGEEKIRSCARTFVIDTFNSGDYPRDTHDICTQFKFTPEQLSGDKGLRAAALSYCKSALSENGRSWVPRELLREGFVTSDDFALPEVKEAAEKAFRQLLERGEINAVRDIREHIALDEAVFEKPEFVAALGQLAQRQLERYDGLGNPLGIIAGLTASTAWNATPRIRELSLPIADRMLIRGYQEDTEKFLSQAGIVDADLAELPGLAGKLARSMELTTLGELNSFLRKESEFLIEVTRHGKDLAVDALTKSAYEAGLALRLKTSETLQLLGKGIDVVALHATKDWDSLATALKAHVPSWQNEIVSHGFDQGARYFGSVEKMLVFMDREKLSRHDALVDMPVIVEMAQQSGLRPSAFYGQVLAQVAKDNAFYGDENAHQRFNHIAKSFRYQATVDRCGEALDVPEVAALAAHFTAGQKAVFASWAHLQQFQRLQELLDKRELLDGLRALSPTERKVLGPFVDEVAIRPGSKADLGQAVNFLVHPEVFLATSDPHTPAHIHNGKKPSNYTKIPHLDLTAKDLTLALAGGEYDLLQHLPPMQIEYRLKNKDGEVITLIATAHQKSDPRGYTVQNDTGSCDSFGAGKQIVSSFNPAISYFSVQLVRADGVRRAIAQSMLTIDCDAERPVPQIVAAMERRGAALDAAVTEAVLRQGQRALTCDNIEVARNYRSAEWGEAIETVYKDFFYEYLQAHGQAAGLRTDTLLVGEHLTPVFSSAPRVANTWIPVAPGSYSDNLGQSIIKLELSPQTDDSQRSITAYGRPPVESLPPSDDVRVQFLRPSDALATAYLEEGAYSDNQALVVSLQSIENCLIAVHVNNRLKHRPDLSLKYVSDEDKVQGYLLAYEGQFKLGDDLPMQAGERMIYIGDLATHADVRRIAGGRLARAFVDRWISEYAPSGEIPPLVAHLREKTSYRMVMAQLRRVEDRTGISFEISEGAPENAGVDRMIPVVIRAKVRESTLSTAGMPGA